MLSNKDLSKGIYELHQQFVETNDRYFLELAISLAVDHDFNPQYRVPAILGAKLLTKREEWLCSTGDVLCGEAGDYKIFDGKNNPWSVQPLPYGLTYVKVSDLDVKYESPFPKEYTPVIKFGITYAKELDAPLTVTTLEKKKDGTPGTWTGQTGDFWLLGVIAEQWGNDRDRFLSAYQALEEIEEPMDFALRMFYRTTGQHA